MTREHRRAKTDRLDTELLKRAFLGWLRGERGHCKMVAVPTLAEEDAKRPSRERETLVGEASRIITRVKAAFVRLGIRGFNPKLKAAATRLETLRTPEDEPIPPNTLAALKRDLERHQIVKKQIREIEQTRLDVLKQAPEKGPHAMVLLLARVIGVGVETADMLVQEVLSRTMRDRRAVGRYAGLTGSPDESGAKRRDKGLARSGNARGRHGMIQLAWRFLLFQKDSALAQWYRQRTAAAPSTRKTLIVAPSRPSGRERAITWDENISGFPRSGGGTHPYSFGHDAVAREAPERDQQLACQRHNQRLARRRGIRRSLPIPLGERTVLLE